MPATILLKSPSGVDDKRIKLANAQFARPFDVGTWSKIRVFCRMSINDNAIMGVGNTIMMFGLCSGTTNLPGDATTQHAVGLGTNSTWTSSSASYYSAVGIFLSRIGTTLSFDLGGGSAGTIGFGRNDAGIQRGLYFLDITKGSPNWTFHYFTRNGSTAVVDVSYDTMMSIAEIETGMSLTGHVLGTSRSFPVDEGTNGALNSVCMWWPRTVPVMEISDLGIVRFA